MEIEVGEYVRTSKGIIGILKEQFTFGNGVNYPEPQEWVLDVNGNEYVANEANYEDIVKHSKNIMKILDSEDIVVLEYYVSKYRKRIKRRFEIFKSDNLINFENAHCSFLYDLNKQEFLDGKGFNPKIKTILTKEQFDSIEYKLEVQDE